MQTLDLIQNIHAFQEVTLPRVSYQTFQQHKK